MMATFCPIMQYHSEHSEGLYPTRDRSPWNIAECTGDPWVLPVCRFYTQLRHRLKPYILQEALHTSATGRPLMCALPLAYPDDTLCRAHPYEYLFGRDLIVCPTVEPGITRQRIYLPRGPWHELWTWDRYDGPFEMEVDVPPNHIPVYVRPACRVPLDTPIPLHTPLT